MDNKSKLKLTTIFSFVFLERELITYNNNLTLLQLFYLSQQSANRLLYYNLYCYLKRLFSRYMSMNYFFLKFIKASLRPLYYLPRYSRFINIQYELLDTEYFLNVFHHKWFHYFPYEFNFTVVPFQSYFLRLDVFSFYFLWTSLENLRSILYNHYITSLNNLWKRPKIRRALLHSWYERKVNRLSQGLESGKYWDANFWHLPLYKTLFIRFFTMSIFNKKISVYNVKFSFENKIPLMFHGHSLESIASMCTTQLLRYFVECDYDTAIDSFLGEAILERLILLLWLFFMKRQSRFSFHTWHVRTYHKYLTFSIRKLPLNDIQWFINRMLYVEFTEYYERFIKKSFLSQGVITYFLLLDLFNYTHSTINDLINFIDSRFVYRVLTMKLSCFFNFKKYMIDNPWKAQLLQQTNLRPFQGFGYLKHKKCRPPGISADVAGRITIVARRKALYRLTNRYLLNFFLLPHYYSYAILGLDYYFWRIFLVNDRQSKLDGNLPFFYFFIKLDIDALLFSRFHSWALPFKHMYFDAAKDTIYTERSKDKLLKEYRTKKTLEQSKDWVAGSGLTFYGIDWPLQERPFIRRIVNPWSVLGLTAYKDMFLQIYSSSLSLSLVFFFLHYDSKKAPYSAAVLTLNKLLISRILTLLRFSEGFYLFMFIDRKYFSHIRADFYRKRRSKTPWLKPLSDEEKLMDDVGPRFARGFNWQLKTTPLWLP